MPLLLPCCVSILQCMADRLSCIHQWQCFSQPQHYSKHQVPSLILLHLSHVNKRARCVSNIVLCVCVCVFIWMSIVEPWEQFLSIALVEAGRWLSLRQMQNGLLSFPSLHVTLCHYYMSCMPVPVAVRSKA